MLLHCHNMLLLTSCIVTSRQGIAQFALYWFGNKAGHGCEWFLFMYSWLSCCHGKNNKLPSKYLDFHQWYAMGVWL